MSDLPDLIANAGEYEAVLDSLEAQISTIQTVHAGEMILPWHMVWIGEETPADRAARERGETLARALKASR